MVFRLIKSMWLWSDLNDAT